MRTEITPGQTSDGVRVLDYRHDDASPSGAWQLTVDGRAGESYSVSLRTTLSLVAEGATIAAKDGSVTTLAVRIPEGSGRLVHTVRLWADR